MEVEEAYDWNEAYEQLMLEYRNKGDHAEMASIIVELLDMLLTNTGLKTSSSLASRLQPVLIRVQPLVSSAVLKKAHSWDAFDDVDLQRKIVVEREERKAKRMVVTVARVKARAELVSKHGGKLENLKRLLQEHMKILELDTRVFLEAQEKLRKLEDFVYGVLNSKVGQVPRIVLRASGYRLLSPWDHRYLLNYMMLLCEEPSHEHIVIVHSGYRSFPHSILVVCDKQDLEKIEPFLITGLHVVRKALYKSANITNIESLDKVTGIVNSYQLAILGEKLWDLRAINVEKSDVQTNMAQEDEGEDADFDVELQAGTEAIATQWLRNYFEDESMSIFKESGLLRVRYTTTEQGDYPRYEHGSFAWLCDKHQNEGVEAGVLEPCPLRTYHNLKYDMEHGFPNRNYAH